MREDNLVYLWIYANLISLRLVYLIVIDILFHAFQITLKEPREGLVSKMSSLNWPQLCRIPSLDHHHLLHGDRFGQIPRKINVESFTYSEPVCDELERDHVE